MRDLANSGTNALRTNLELLRDAVQIPLNKPSRVPRSAGMPAQGAGENQDAAYEQLGEPVHRPGPDRALFDSLHDQAAQRLEDLLEVSVQDLFAALGARKALGLAQ